MLSVWRKLKPALHLDEFLKAALIELLLFERSGVLLQNFE
jgi:hypothetical protein